MLDEGWEIDYLPVGDGKSSGDAILVKFGDLNRGSRNGFKVVVIDGGTVDSGTAVVDHLEDFTGDNLIDLAVVTHADNDHVCGMEPILKGCRVGGLLMHAPWVVDSRLSLIKSLEKAQDIYKLAIDAGVDHYDPLAHTSFFNGTLKVMGPSIDYYTSLLPQFDAPAKMLAPISKQNITETPDLSTETLDDAHKYTSPTNNSSVILLFTFGDKKALFTGDAGVDAITRAVEYSYGLGEDISNLHFFHIPHHGSHHNITTDLIDFFSPNTSFSSASALAKKHPHPRVNNAFHRRKLPVYTTKGKALRHYHNAPNRPLWSQAPLAPFVQQFEA